MLVEGKARIGAGGLDFGELGDRMDVFEATPPHCVYVPDGSDWSATATTACTLAVCTAPGKGGHAAQVIGPAGIERATRGKGANTRHIYPIAMEERDVADSLLVTEVFTPQGNWSSYPPHRHDEDDFPRMTYLEESYYHRLNPAAGLRAAAGLHRGRLARRDDGGRQTTTWCWCRRATTPAPRPTAIDLYYLNVMAGPLRKWRFQNHPDLDWIFQRDR